MPVRLKRALDSDLASPVVISGSRSSLLPRSFPPLDLALDPASALHRRLSTLSAMQQDALRAAHDRAPASASSAARSVQNSGGRDDGASAAASDWWTPEALEAVRRQQSGAQAARTAAGAAGPIGAERLGGASLLSQALDARAASRADTLPLVQLLPRSFPPSVTSRKRRRSLSGAARRTAPARPPQDTNLPPSASPPFRGTAQTPTHPRLPLPLPAPSSSSPSTLSRSPGRSPSTASAASTATAAPTAPSRTRPRPPLHPARASSRRRQASSTTSSCRGTARARRAHPRTRPACSASARRRRPASRA